MFSLFQKKVLKKTPSADAKCACDDVRETRESVETAEKESVEVDTGYELAEKYRDIYDTILPIRQSSVRDQQLLEKQIREQYKKDGGEWWLSKHMEALIFRKICGGYFSTKLFTCQKEYIKRNCRWAMIPLVLADMFGTVPTRAIFSKRSFAPAVFNFDFFEPRHTYGETATVEDDSFIENAETVTSVLYSIYTRLALRAEKKRYISMLREMDASSAGGVRLFEEQLIDWIYGTFHSEEAQKIEEKLLQIEKRNEVYMEIEHYVDKIASCAKEHAERLDSERMRLKVEAVCELWKPINKFNKEIENMDVWSYFDNLMRCCIVSTSSYVRVETMNDWLSSKE